MRDSSLTTPADLLRRDFTATAANTRWVADYTYVPIEGQTAHVAFVSDLYARAIVGWRLAEHQRTDLGTMHRSIRGRRAPVERVVKGVGG
jgi:transposase InsO family protein